MTSIRHNLLRPSLDWLLIFLPVTVWAEDARPDSHRLTFLSACLAIIPLAGLLGQATEHIAASPYVAFLGRIPGTRRFSDVDRHPDNEVIPGVLVFRVEALLL